MRAAVVILIVCVPVAFAINKWRKESKDMAMIYASLIIKGTRTIESVPAVIKEQVKQILIDLEVPELAEENV